MNGISICIIKVSFFIHIINVIYFLSDVIHIVNIQLGINSEIKVYTSRTFARLSITLQLIIGSAGAMWLVINFIANL